MVDWSGVGCAGDGGLSEAGGRGPPETREGHGSF